HVVHVEQVFRKDRWEAGDSDKAVVGMDGGMQGGT
ncbi:uncharacterized, partial [Tachysurus ichikawai]